MNECSKSRLEMIVRQVDTRVRFALDVQLWVESPLITERLSNCNVYC